MKRLVVAAAFAMFSLSAQALTGNQVWGEVRDEANNVNPSYNTGYVQGYVQGIAVASRDYICVPKGADGSQAISVVYNYMQRNAATRNEEFVVIVMNSLMEAWPCQKR